jgi:hypothetical protein
VAQEEQIHQTSSFPVQTAQAIDVLAFGPLNQHIFCFHSLTQCVHYRWQTTFELNPRRGERNESVLENDYYSPQDNDSKLTAFTTHGFFFSAISRKGCFSTFGGFSTDLFIS